MKKIPFLYLVKILKYSFSKLPKLYLVFLFSIFSIFIEIAAINLLALMSSFDQFKTKDLYHKLTDIVGEINPEILFILFIGLFIIRLITMTISESLLIAFGKKLQASLSLDAFSKILNQVNIKEIENKSIGYFISLSGDEAVRASGVLVSLVRLSNSTILIIFYFFTLCYYSLYGGIIAGSVILFMSAFSIYIMKKSHQFGKKLLDESRQANSVFMDSLHGIRSVRAFNAEKFAADEYTDVISKYMRTNFLIETYQYVSKTMPLIILFVLSGMFASYQYLYSSHFNATFYMTLLFLLMRFFYSFGDVLIIVTKVITESKSGQNITDFILSETPKSTEEDFLKESIHTVNVKNLYFEYNKSKRVFSNLSLSFEQGKSYAIIGSSGAGKSTLLNLLLKFYTPDSGSILVNNKNIDHFTEHSIREKILLLGQDSVIFNDTIRKNLEFGKQYRDSEVEKALRLACAKSIIDELPKGLETVLHYRGANLSGGQKQRLVIARALLREFDILILDESTSALDYETRTQVIENILSHYPDKIIIFVTHDLEIQKMVDSVIDLTLISTEIE